MTVTASKYKKKPNDLYETETWATHACIRALNKLELWRGTPIWEPAAGNHAMVGPLAWAGASDVITSDITRYEHEHTAIFDFTTDQDPTFLPEQFDIVSNPPYGPSNRTAVKFAEKALQRCSGYVALLLTAKFDFGVTRQHLFANNHRFTAKVSLLDRISWEGNGETGTEDHAWYIWGPRNATCQHAQILYEQNLDKGRSLSE